PRIRSSPVRSNGTKWYARAVISRCSGIADPMPTATSRPNPKTCCIEGGDMRAMWYLLAALLLKPIAGFAQAPAGDGSKSYAARCAGCHGADARGTDRGPGLARSRRLQARSTQQLRALIQKGVPTSGMPAFDLPGDELDALTTLIHSM